MTSSKQALAKVRAALGKLGEITEGGHFGAVAFKTGGKLFATFRDHGDDWELVFGLEPEHAATLLDRDPRFEAYPRAPHTLVARGSRVDDWRRLAPLLRESYGLVAAKKKAPARKAARRSRAR